MNFPVATPLNWPVCSGQLISYGHMQHKTTEVIKLNQEVPSASPNQAQSSESKALTGMTAPRAETEWSGDWPSDAARQGARPDGQPHMETQSPSILTQGRGQARSQPKRRRNIELNEIHCMNCLLISK